MNQRNAAAEIAAKELRRHVELERSFGVEFVPRGEEPGEALRAFEQGKTFLLEIDVQGASQVMKKHTGALSIFIQPPENEKTLVERLKGRSTEDDAEIEKRIQTARREMAEKAHYQYVVENDELDRAVDEVKRIIERAERGK